jgi:hypothetical protein
MRRRTDPLYCISNNKLRKELDEIVTFWKLLDTDVSYINLNGGACSLLLWTADKRVIPDTGNKLKIFHRKAMEDGDGLSKHNG